MSYEIFQEFERRDPKVLERKPWCEGMFEQQEALFYDTSPFVAAFCTRRAGKTDCASRKLIDMSMAHPDLPVDYICITGDQAARNMEAELDKLVAKHDLPYTKKTIHQAKRYCHREGGYIRLVGCKDTSELGKFRGGKLAGAIIDEAQDFREDLLPQLVYDALQPKLSDVGAQLWLSGTPGPLPEGMWFDVTTGEGEQPQWPTHSWSVIDNPYHPWGLAQIEAFAEARGWALDHPTIQREYFGRWVLDTAALIYEFDPQKNYYDELPPGKPVYWLGIDLGWTDATAFTLTANIPGTPEVYVVRSYGKSHLVVDDIAREIEALKAAYPIGGRIVADTGGLGKSMVESLKKTYGIQMRAAEKRDKAANIRTVQNALATGNLKVHPEHAKQLLSEAKKLPWNEKHSDHHPSRPDHCTDALLYSFRAQGVRLDPMGKLAVVSPQRDPDYDPYEEYLDRLERQGKRPPGFGNRERHHKPPPGFGSPRGFILKP